MSNTTDVYVNQLVINELSREKYLELSAAGQLQSNQLYLVDEDNLDAASGVISNVGTPVSPTDAANKSYVDTVSSNIVTAFPEIPDNIVINNAGNNTSNLAIGTNTAAYGNNSVLIGNSTKGEGIAIGYDTSANAFSIAMGCHAKATRDNSIATGYCAQATSYASIATGYCAQATGNSSIATGYGAQATSEGSIAIGGCHAQATSEGSIATGFAAKAEGYSSIATGLGAQATNWGSIAIGCSASAVSDNTVAIGAHCHAASGDVSATTDTPIVIGSNAYGVAAAQIRVTKEGVMTVGGKEVGKSLFETKTFTTDSQAGESDLMIIAKQENGVQPRLHAGDKDIHGVTGFSNESDKYTGQRYILDWDLAMSNDTSYLMGATKWTSNRFFACGIAGSGTTGLCATYVQPLLPVNTDANTSRIFPYAIPCFENSPLHWKGHLTWDGGKQIYFPFDNIPTNTSATVAVYTNDTIAIGCGAEATNGSSIATGRSAEATGWNSIATGLGAQATSCHSIATGYYAQATGNRSIATGHYAQATGENSIATGLCAQATADYSIATGLCAQAICHSAIAIGYNASATNGSSIATGRSAQATGSRSIATGFYACAKDDYTIAIGASKNNNYSVSASTAVPIVIGSDYSSVSAAQIKVTNTGIMSVGGNPLARKQFIIDDVKQSNNTTATTRMVKQYGDIWFAATTSGVYTSTDNAKTWTVTSRTAATASVFHVEKDTWLAGGFSSSDGNGIHITHDNGVTWTTVNTTYCPWSFCRGKLVIDGVEYSDAIVASCTQRKGMIYSLDNGETWNDGAGWSDIDTGAFDVQYIKDGFVRNNTTYHWIMGGGYVAGNNGGIWYLDEATFAWIQEPIMATDETNPKLLPCQHKVYSVAVYTTKTGKKRIYWNDCGDLAGTGGIYYIDENDTTCHKISGLTVYVYNFVENPADGYLYITAFGGGELLQISDDGNSFTKIATPAVTGVHGYAFDISEDNTYFVMGYDGQGFATVQCPNNIVYSDVICDIINTQVKQSDLDKKVIVRIWAD